MIWTLFWRSLRVGCGHDVAGNVTNVAYPSSTVMGPYTVGMNVAYDYDALNRISAIHQGTNGVAVAVASYTNDAAGRPAKRTLANGTETVYGWDAGGNVTNMSLRLSATPTNVLWSAAYGYDAVGNRTWVKNQNGRGDVYHYDAAYQVTGVKYNVDDPTVGYASAANPSRTVTYGYDALGNRTSVTDNGSTTSYSINNLNQYTWVGTTNLSYDTRGNLTGDGVWTYGYDSMNRLISASKTGSTASYFYDGLDRRLAKIVNGVMTSYVYSGRNLIQEWNGTTYPTLTAEYVYEGGLDRPVAVIKGGNTYYFQQDALGNVAALVNASGQITEQYSYDIYGQPTIKDGSGNVLTGASTPFLFTGREYESETGLYHYRARAYSPALGRFLQADPISFNGGDVNVYRYCANNPINLIDSDGLYVTYAGGGSKAFWGNFTKAFQNAWKTKKGREELEKAYDSCKEYRFGPFQNGDWTGNAGTTSGEKDENGGYISIRFNPDRPGDGPTIGHETSHGLDVENAIDATGRAWVNGSHDGPSETTAREAEAEIRQDLYGQGINPYK